MKKNLRIVSAAAAALLAVAPVAASSVSTALAANNGITVPVNGSTTPQTVDKIEAKLNVTNAAKLSDGVSPTQVAANITTTSLPAGATIVPGKADIYATGSDGKKTGAPVTDKLVAGTKYVAVVNVAITGLTKFAGKTIKVNDENAVQVNGSGIIAAVELTSDPFTVPNTALKGAPYITYDNHGTPTIADSGSIDLDKLPAISVDDLYTAITNKYKVAMTATGNGSAQGDYQDLKQDIRDALKAAGVTVKTNGAFDKPAAPFTITAHLYATNGKTATFAIRVNSGESNGDETFPYMYFNTDRTTDPQTNALVGVQSLDSIGDVKFNYVPVNGVVDVKAIQDAFKTYVSKTSQTMITPKVDISKVNTKVAGKYPVTVSATNADGKTTKVTFLLTVGVKGAEYKTVQSDGDVPVYKIDGNTVTDTKTTVKNGDQIAIFGQPIKIGNKTYVRINSADSDLYVEAKYVDGTFKSAEKTKKTVMHNAYIYDKDHKRVGTNMLRAYTSVEVIGKATKLADGSLVYKIGDNQYVMADNITGTSRTLTHNAYVYKTSRKRANRTVLKKGTTVTTYGAPYTFKNGKRYYRIGGPAKQYVKVANF